MIDVDGMTVKEYRERIMRQARKKIKCCRVCKATVRLYRYTITGEIAFSLVRLYLLGKGGHHYTAFTNPTKGRRNSGGSYSRLCYWGLIEKRGRGTWAITERGRRFVHGKVALLSHCIVLRAKVLRWDSDKYIYIADCQDEKFNLAEAMNT